MSTAMEVAYLAEAFYAEAQRRQQMMEKRLNEALLFGPAPWRPVIANRAPRKLKKRILKACRAEGFVGTFAELRRAATG